MTRNPYLAYSQLHSHVSKIRQVIMLYEGISKNLIRFKKSFEEEDLELRSTTFSKIHNIILGLQSALDHKGAPELTGQLEVFYDNLYNRLSIILNEHNYEDVDKLIFEVNNTKDAWETIEKSQNSNIQENNAVNQ